MTLRRYERYKDSGVEWIGAVPAHWDVAAVGYRYEVLLGKMLDEKRITGKHLAPYLRNIDVQWDRINVEDLPQMDFSGDDINRYSVVPGDLLVCEGGEVGRAAIWRGELSECYYQKAIHRLRRRREAADHPRFMFYVLRMAAAIGVFEASEGKSTIAHLTAESLRRYRFAFPLRREQECIVQFLDQEAAKIDLLIAEQQRLIELLTEKRLAVIAHAVTKGLNPAAPMKDSGVEWIGVVPAHWRVSALGYVACIETGSTPDRGNSEFWEGDIPWIKTGEINYQPIRTAEEYITDLGLSNSAAKIAPPGTMLMAMYGQGVTRGRVAILEIACAYNQACAAISFGTSVDVRFARYFFIAAYEHVRDAGNETSQMNLSAGIIRKFKLTVPPISDQREIVAFLDDESSRIDRLFLEAEQATALLRERRTALISAAVTGQIDVRNSASVESALAETRADIAAGRYVVESAAMHVARVQAMAAADEHSPSPPHSC
jgi:type I restriction enzyme S subunit